MKDLTKFNDVLAARRAELQADIEAIDRLMKWEPMPGFTAAPKPMKRAYKKREPKADKGGGKRHAMGADASESLEDAKPKRYNCPRCQQSKLYEPGRHHRSICPDCEKKLEGMRVPT
jgi:hypothetical protein